MISIKLSLPGVLAAMCFLAAVTATTRGAESTEIDQDLMAKRPKFARAEGVAYQFEGVLLEYLEAISKNWLEVVPTRNPVMLSMFADREQETRPLRRRGVRGHEVVVVGHNSAGELAGKYLTGAAQVLSLTNDKELRDYLEGFVKRLLELQGENGYLGPWPKKHQLTGQMSVPRSHPLYRSPGWDAWGHYHIMLGLLYWHQQTQDKKALGAARKIGDLLCNTFLGKLDKAIRIDMGHYMVNLSPFHSLCLLYQQTRNRRYLELAQQIVHHEIPNAKQFDGSPGNRYIRDALAGKEYYQFPGPRWECLHTIQGLAALYEITGKERYRKVFEHLWWSIVKLDRHNTGGFSSAEQAMGSPYHRGAIETCATVAWSAMSVDMLRLTGNSIVADELELTLMNAVFGSHSRTGRWSTYDTPMDGTRVASFIVLAGHSKENFEPGTGDDLNCCSVNAARGLGLVSDWALMTDDQGLVLNWYGPSQMTTRVKGVPVTLKQETDYPRTGRILLKVSPSKNMKFALILRIPYWSENNRVAVNGQSFKEVKRGSYLEIFREWRPGDTVEMELDMSLHYWGGEQECEGTTSIYRGPLLLAYDTKASGKEGIPTFDARHMKVQLIETKDGSEATVRLACSDVNGRKVNLSDFDSAGENGTFYVSWLKVLNVQNTPFSVHNPLRSGRGPK